jgi:hypothetical protein
MRRSPGRCRPIGLGCERGQALLEFFFAVLLAMVLILGVLQVGLLFNAHSMVKLAAFNAARAAIVARGATPDAPATIKDMRSSAKLAAFLTILPVIPAFHGKLPPSTNPAQLLNAANVASLGLGALVEFLGKSFGDSPGQLRDNIDVQFLVADDKPPGQGTPLSFASAVEFDDQSRAADDVVRVEVTWNYPLVIPIINRIIIAVVKPQIYFAALVAGGVNPALAQQIVDARLDAQRQPIWAVGSSLDRAFSLDSVLKLTSRIPVRASYVMRMQWDRGPS